MRRIGTLIVFIISPFIVFAQVKNSKITGAVVDGNQKTIESSTITLLRAKDSSVVRMSIADKNGKFAFENIPMGKYVVSITAVGHRKGFSESFEISSGNSIVELKTIELIPQTKSMNGIVVMARKPLIEQKIDRIIVNVDAAVSNVGATALEVLEKSPGVTIDKDGNISLKGKQNVQIYVDGKPSYLNGDQLVIMLKSMNASQLDQIEIMTNPPAKYDAAGNAGIINIKMKKNKQIGFNGNTTASYSQGKYVRTNESLNMNYRNSKMNAFMNYSFYKNNSFQIGRASCRER